MTEPSHHDLLVAALKANWRNAGGPLSLTAWLGHCRSTVEPLRQRGVPWAWVAPRLLAVFEDPEGAVAEPLARLPTKRERIVIELYARVGRRARSAGSRDGVNGRPLEPQLGKAVATASNALSATPSKPAPSPRGADPPLSRRARIRQSARVTNKLGQFE